MAHTCTSKFNTVSCIQLKLLPVLEKQAGFPSMSWKPLSSSPAALVATTLHVAFSTQMLVRQVIQEAPELPVVPQMSGQPGQEGKVVKEPQNNHCNCSNIPSTHPWLQPCRDMVMLMQGLDVAFSSHPSTAGLQPDLTSQPLGWAGSS